MMNDSVFTKQELQEMGYKPADECSLVAQMVAARHLAAKYEHMGLSRAFWRGQRTAYGVMIEKLTGSEVRFCPESTSVCMYEVGGTCYAVQTSVDDLVMVKRVY